ncbi:MAG: SAM-dependent methyltransferase [Myxococcota bacterium]|jgi:SAM-dependent methyltransferase
MAETFEVWRCAGCQSVHAQGKVDLDAYYASYPVHDVPLDWRTRPMFDKLRRRLLRAGMKRTDTVLDYGCGSGAFLRFLAWAKHPNAVGFDAYTNAYADTAVLDGFYDCVVSQDVIEHVPDPLVFLDTMNRLTRPGGLIAVGTPDAAGIRLDDPEADVHALHQPYHRHILSAAALRAAGAARGWVVVKHHRTMYVNTPWPFVNSRFVAMLMKARDNTLDTTLEPPSWKLVAMLPWTLSVGLFGALWPAKSEMMTIFRKPV